MDFLSSFFFCKRLELYLECNLFSSSDLYIIFLSMNCISITDDYSAAKEIDKHRFILFLILIFHEILLYTSNSCFSIKRFNVNNYSNPGQVFHTFFLFVAFISGVFQNYDRL